MNSEVTTSACQWYQWAHQLLQGMVSFSVVLCSDVFSVQRQWKNWTGASEMFRDRRMNVKIKGKLYRMNVKIKGKLYRILSIKTSTGEQGRDIGGHRNGNATMDVQSRKA